MIKSFLFDNVRYRFNVTLFGELVDELTSFITSADKPNVVVALTFAKLKDFQGMSNLYWIRFPKLV